MVVKPLIEPSSKSSGEPNAYLLVPVKRFKRSEIEILCKPLWMDIVRSDEMNDVVNETLTARACLGA